MIETSLTSDLDAHLRAIALRLGTIDTDVQASVTKAALNLKREWRTEASGHRNLPYLPAAVQVDDIPDGKRVSFGDGNQGQIAHIGVFGAPKTAPFMNPFRHIPVELTVLRRYMGEIGARL